MLSSLSIDHLLTRESSGPDDLLFHYTSRESLRSILETRTLRLSTLGGMSDPRERSEWSAGGVVMPPGDVNPESLAAQDEVIGQIDEVLRLGARVACLTSDRGRADNAGTGTFFHRGWGRARMWEQYGQQHRGAVLVFDKVGLIEALDQERDFGDGDVFAPSPVAYIDRALDVPLSGYFETVAAIREALDDLTSQGKAIRDLFFVKNSDWSGETEFRILVVLGEDSGQVNRGGPLCLSYRDTLRAVVLGERWDGADWLADS